MEKRTHERPDAVQEEFWREASKWRDDRSGDSVTKLRFWQLSDGLNTAPYLVMSPVPYFNKKMVEGRLCGLSSWGTSAILEDLSAFAQERGLFLRVYTAIVDGGDLIPFPNTMEEIGRKKALILNNRMPVYLRSVIANIIGQPADINLTNVIAEDTSLINAIWEDPVFSHVNLMGWTGDYSFGRQIHKRVNFYAIRDKSCIRDIRCHQNQKIDKSSVIMI